MAESVGAAAVCADGAGQWDDLSFLPTRSLLRHDHDVNAGKVKWSSLKCGSLGRVDD
jgi:hypothetical protein